ncbi:MAG: ATP-binding protein [Bacteroidales bacterium]
MNKDEKLLLINEIFTPSSPVENRDLFIGRQTAIHEFREIVFEKGLHGVVIGPRGVGKTSLVNMSRFLFNNLLIIKVTCNRNDTFNSLWERAFKKIRFVQPISELGFKGSEKVEIVPISFPQQSLLNATEIENILTDLNQNSLFIFDEFDSLKNTEVKTQMADLLKMLSDNLPNITILLVGLAQSAEKLIGEQYSIERCIKQIFLSPFHQKEAEKMIVENLTAIGLKIDKEILITIIKLSAGFPNYLHLLCKNSSIEAVQDDSDGIYKPHLDKAVYRSIENSHFTIKNAYTKAVNNNQESSMFEDLLFACVNAKKDRENTFGIEEVIMQLKKMKGKDLNPDSINRNLGLLCKKEKSEILTKLGRQRNSRFIFKKPQIMAFVNLKHYQINEIG